MKEYIEREKGGTDCDGGVYMAGGLRSGLSVLATRDNMDMVFVSVVVNQDNMEMVSDYI